MKITGHTKICAVIGDPIEHSLSPVMHNAALQHLGLDVIYVAFRVRGEALEDAVKGVRSLNIYGLNVTMPHKTAIIKYLDEVDPIAKDIESVNTVLNVNGKLIGFNTDGIGALNALRYNHADPKGRRVLILGAGGAAKAIAYQIAASNAEKIVIINRTGEKAKELAKFLRKRFKVKIMGKQLSTITLRKALKETDILINATSVGMRPYNDQTLIDKQWLRRDMTVMDIVYDPVETKLLIDAKNIGAKVINGIDMLLYQGAESFKIWFRVDPPIDVMRKAIIEELERRTGNAS
ncbi:MAG: shikimate dehydrogenase [Candidatus Bathyarchaeia archaeon]|nr:shikimate dehydrogenase [Candidatus Bathyarchaeota archaeon]